MLVLALVFIWIVTDRLLGYNPSCIGVESKLAYT